MARVKNKKKNRSLETNYRARIASNQTFNGNVCTRTTNRDDGSLNVQVVSHGLTGEGRTSLNLFGDGFTLKLNGKQARTLYSVLQAHYYETFRAT